MGPIVRHTCGRLPCFASRIVQPRALLVLLLITAGACQGDAPAYPWLGGLDADDPFPSGARLLALPHGLHPLEQAAPPAEPAKRVLVAVHGWHSRGYEWVHLLKTLDDLQTSVWFYRWNDDGCPQPASAALLEGLHAAIDQATERVVLVGHSYGGLVLAELLDRWPMDLPAEMHIVASPLASVREGPCNYIPPTALARNVRLFEWRTQWHLDGAFKDLPSDPQMVDIPGSHVTRLPSEYNGHRLGHNRSLSWVADTLAAHRQPAGQD